MAVLIFFLSHWYLSLFSQSFFLHRYGAHKQFSMTPFMEKLFYIFTFIAQGSSVLSVRAYGILHRMHHEYSDTEKDPHSPHFYKTVFTMMWNTKKIYQNVYTGKFSPGTEFEKDIPNWEKFERFYDNFAVRFTWGFLYTVFYVFFATHWWMYLLLPIHFLMGPIHGAIVNWSGHKYGYRNFDLPDKSRNSLPWDFILLGELFQNNHHAVPDSPNFAKRWFEIDFAYPFILILKGVRIIR